MLLSPFTRMMPIFFTLPKGERIMTIREFYLTPVERYVADRLLAKRKELNMSQADLGNALRLTQAQISAMELGKTAWGIDTLNDAARVFGCSPKDFLPQEPMIDFPSHAQTPLLRTLQQDLEAYEKIKHYWEQTNRLPRDTDTLSLRRGDLKAIARTVETSTEPEKDMVTIHQKAQVLTDFLENIRGTSVRDRANILNQFEEHYGNQEALASLKAQYMQRTIG